MIRTASLVAVLGLVACAPPAADEVALDPVALVGVAPVVDGAIVESVRLYGAAENGAAGRLAVSAPFEAIVAAIAAPVGSAVQRGDVVVRLTPSPASRLEGVRGQGDARLAVAAAARAERLRADGLVGNAEVETARAAAVSATAAAASLGARAAGLTLRAPVAGYVDTLVPAVGDFVAGGSTVATIARTGNLRARFGVDPALARRIGPGATLRIQPVGGDAPFATRILSIDPVVDPQTRLASIYAAIPAATGIGAGETLSTELRIPGGAGGLSIPYAAVLDDAGQAFVYVVAGGVARRRNVTVGAQDGDRVAVTGLVRGALVVVAGGTALADGIRVRTR